MTILVDCYHRTRKTWNCDAPKVYPDIDYIECVGGVVTLVNRNGDAHPVDPRYERIYRVKPAQMD